MDQMNDKKSRDIDNSTPEAASALSAGLGDLGRALVNATREKRGERPAFLCQLEIDPRDPSAIIEGLTEERDRYKDALARLYNAATSVRIFVNSRECIEQTTGKQWFEDELAAALASLKNDA